jgi:NADH dehydrogenase FAD-containing subunit
VLLADVADFDSVQQRVHFDDGQLIPYYFLVLAAGTTHQYFGQDAD